MSTLRIQIDPDDIKRSDLRKVADIVRDGGLVAFPTETVYGLGANAWDEQAVEKIFQAKKRPADHPLIVHVASLDQARSLVLSWPEEAELLAQKFWPGPLTLVLAKTPNLPDLVTAGLPTVGIRMPSSPVALALIEEAGVPIAAPSANPHMGVSSTRTSHLPDELVQLVDAVIDSGATSFGIESTVVDVVGRRLLRPGAIPRLALEGILGPLEIADVNADGPRSSPGMSARHYAPDALVIIADPAARAMAGERLVGVLRFPSAEPIVDALVIELPDDPEVYARGLYDSLHRFDKAGCELVFIEPPPAEAKWEAVRDRIYRAATREERSE